ncbi:MAG TPA: rhamnogalacturonan acetylesterase [Pyrinomonadaceae bacterium]|nr:rhamnogalacturonan acetylesterase [Pyrinomonadaceae bacterium]
MKISFAVFLVLLLSSLGVGQQQITIFLAGDSTMAAKLPNKRPETGWGEELQNFFDASKVNVENHAQNGRSTRSFIAENRWQAIVDKLRKGDYVFIEFGHNDQKVNTDRYASPVDYRKNLERFVADVLRKEGIPVLLTPVMRRRFDEAGRFYDTHGEYPEAVRGAAAEYKVAIIDMHRKSEVVLKQHGPEDSKKLFLQLKPGENPNYPAGIEDNTHFSPQGARIMAGLAVEGIREQKLGLAKYLKK